MSDSLHLGGKWPSLSLCETAAERRISFARIATHSYIAKMRWVQHLLYTYRPITCTMNNIVWPLIGVRGIKLDAFRAICWVNRRRKLRRYRIGRVSWLSVVTDVNRIVTGPARLRFVNHCTAVVDSAFRPNFCLRADGSTVSTETQQRSQNVQTFTAKNHKIRKRS